MKRFVYAVLVASLFVVPELTALANPTGGKRQCVAPWGTNWNQALSVFDADIVSPFCTRVERNVRFIPEVKWITNTPDGQPGHPVLYPDGYKPSFAAPMADFIHKLEAVRYVVQPTGQEYVMPANQLEALQLELLTVGVLYTGDDHEFTPDQYVWPSLSLLGRLPPLPPGEYEVEVHLIMLDTTCDGQTDDFEMSCLPPGDTLAVSRDVIVSQ